MSNGYTRLKQIAEKYADKIQSRKKIDLGYFEKKNLMFCNLSEVHAKVETAFNLGYDTFLTATTDKLVITHVEKLPTRPWDI